MSHPRLVGVALLSSLALGLAVLAAPGHAGLGGALKRKLSEKAEKKIEDGVDKADEKATGDDKEKAEPSGTAAGKAGGGKVSTVSTKFDYVPGDKVQVIDDFTQDELGEFPVKWKLTQGTFEVAEKNGERWLRCTSVDGRIGMKLEGIKELPEFYTFEFDLDCEEPMGSAYTVTALAANEEKVWAVTYPEGTNLVLRSGTISSSTPLEGAPAIGGRHHMMFMARGKALKVYMDNQRLANVPEVRTDRGPAIDLELRLWSTTKPMITNVRFAEGCRPPKDMLAEGKLVTYGIRFATGSDVVLPESAPVLRQVAAYMQANPVIRLQITGHTDNVGSAASNLDLSKRRAASVAKVLADQFNVAADRFGTDGKGDTQTIASNAKPEGRAMNRRVEFTKL